MLDSSLSNCFRVSVIWKQVTPVNYAGKFLKPNLPA